jgi:AcrR family transcriptional regulator
MHNVTVLDTNPEGLRERKKAKTRRALEDAALALFIRHGFDGTTVEQIADACDVSPRTFFRYFSTKEDALFGDSREKLETFIDALEARPGGEAPLRSMRAAALTLMQTHEARRERLKARAQIVAATPLLRAHGSERQADWNQAAIEVLTGRSSGTIADEGQTPLVIRLVVVASTAAIHAAVETWLNDTTGVELIALVEQAFDLLAVGLDG